MGADWVRFRIPKNADIEDIRARARFVSVQYNYEREFLPHPDFRDDETTRNKWCREFNRLQQFLEFPLGSRLDYWDHRNMTDPLNLDLGEGIDAIDACRVYVISRNPVFPIEWRDDAYRIILPDELSPQLGKWKHWIDEIREGKWKHFLHELFLYDRLSNEYLHELLEDLLWSAQESLTRPNNWCQKDKLKPVRERILKTKLVDQLAALRRESEVPQFRDADCLRQPSPEQLDREERFFQIRQSAAEQIRDWNPCVPGKWKIRFPQKQTFDDFKAKADDSWLQSFFRWCEFLCDTGHGLFLWA